jgi:hypothetical protein
MIIPLNVKNQSIETSGITSDYKEAIAEYIWNGFEAQANHVNIEYTLNGLSGINTLSIIDDGTGINYNELSETFGAFLTSKKTSLSMFMKSKANKGKGRFSFCAFAGNVVWETVYKDGDLYKQFEIRMSNEKKEAADCSEPEISIKTKTGTKVTFYNIFTLSSANLQLETIEDSLLKNFAWLLYLYKNKNMSISLAGQCLDYNNYINMDLSSKSLTMIDENEFEITLIVWREHIKEKYCCYYYDDFDILKGKDTTSFNRNTIGFNHSVFVKSDFFQDKNDVTINDDEVINLFESSKEKKIIKKLKMIIQDFIEKQIGKYLSEKAEVAVVEMITVKKTFPKFTDDRYGQIRMQDLKKITQEIYKLEPRIFYKLNSYQEKSLLGLLNLILDSEERENVLNIIEQIVELSPDQRNDFSQTLKKTSLENIIDTIKFIEGRYKVIELLKTMVYDIPKYTNERDHIQKIVEQHFWLFGEKFNLASADRQMEKALAGYSNILYGENDPTIHLKPDLENQRRMDIFMCRERGVENKFGAMMDENIVVELKAPNVMLTKKVYRQIEDYMDYVHRHSEFNSEHRTWKFIAVSKEIDDYVKSQYTAFEEKGKLGLVSQVGNYEVYAFTWDDIFRSFELIHQPVLDKLKYDREKIAEELLEEVKNLEGRERVDALTELSTAK